MQAVSDSTSAPVMVADTVLARLFAIIITFLYPPLLIINYICAIVISAAKTPRIDCGAPHVLS